MKDMFITPMKEQLISLKREKEFTFNTEQQTMLIQHKTGVDLENRIIGGISDVNDMTLRLQVN